MASCAATGATTRQIADELFISVRTVESHLGSIYRKLDVSTRAGLVAKLSRNGMLTADEHDRGRADPRAGPSPPTSWAARTRSHACAAAAAASRAGTTRAVLIGGESGVGKSSLLAAALDEIRTDAATSIFVANCFDGISTPFGPVAEALQHHLRGHSGELTEVVGPNGGVLASLLPAMADRLPPVRADLDLAARPRLVVDSFRHTLAHASVRRPVVLVLEDLHWVDQATVAFLRAMITESSDRRVLLVGTFRDTELAMAHPLPGLLADLWKVPSVERINLSGLTLDDASELFARLGGRASAAGAVAGLHEASAGNSLYLSSLLRDVAEGSPSDRLPLSVREAVAQTASPASEAPMAPSWTSLRSPDSTSTSRSSRPQRSTSARSATTRCSTRLSRRPAPACSPSRPSRTPTTGSCTTSFARRCSKASAPRAWRASTRRWGRRWPTSAGSTRERGP